MKNIYAIKDTKADEYIGQALQLMRNDQPAIRTFRDLIADTKTTIGQHPEDYELHCLGALADNGEITPEYRVVSTGAAISAVIKGEA